MDLARLQKQLSAEDKSLPPVSKWNPAFCGDIDMLIKRDGSWHYMGTPIGRKALVKLFSTVLRKEDDTYFLVTPVEKVGITVEDVPFVVSTWDWVDGHLVFNTLTEDRFIVGEQHPVELREDPSGDTLIPYVLVRDNLWARLHQNVYYQLIEQGQLTQKDDAVHLLVKSGDYQFSLGIIPN
ncbi:DUF1285 domain-containing protein [Aestuariibacter salexigens]|uniref:DUF1285 domain-containing protein n=1 Tax=Aestuariibacter salexigens TaxID=226010 RepID=UPI0004134CE8|nr:DUF1285 domain-containing protein [Aestuariibacter salexigens]